METVLTSKGVKEINFAPRTVAEEVIQNLQTILTTYKGTVPLDRDFGISMDLVDNPVRERLKVKIYNDMLNAIRRYEPRCSLLGIVVESDEDGKVQIGIKVDIKEDTVI